MWHGVWSTRREAIQCILGSSYSPPPPPLETVWGDGYSWLVDWEGRLSPSCSPFSFPWWELWQMGLGGGMGRAQGQQADRLTRRKSHRNQEHQAASVPLRNPPHTRVHIPRRGSICVWQREGGPDYDSADDKPPALFFMLMTIPPLLFLGGGWGKGGRDGTLWVV